MHEEPARFKGEADAHCLQAAHGITGNLRTDATTGPAVGGRTVVRVCVTRENKTSRMLPNPMTPDTAIVAGAKEKLSLAVGTTPGKVAEQRHHLLLQEAFSPEPVHSAALAFGAHHFYLLLETAAFAVTARMVSNAFEDNSIRQQLTLRIHHQGNCSALIW